MMAPKHFLAFCLLLNTIANGLATIPVGVPRLHQAERTISVLRYVNSSDISTNGISRTVAQDNDGCTHAGVSCSNDCRSIQVCKENGSNFVMSKILPCPNDTPYCDVDTFACSKKCNSGNTPTLPKRAAETCTEMGPRCSEDCRKIEVCEEVGNNYTLSSVVQCSWPTQYCNLDTLTCSDVCKRGKYESTTVTDTSSTQAPEICTEMGPRCSDDCRKIEVCEEVGNNYTLSSVVQCSWPTQYCNLDQLACSDVCKRGKYETTTVIISSSSSSTDTVTPSSSTTETITPSSSTTETITPSSSTTVTVTPSSSTIETVTPSSSTTETVTPSSSTTVTVTPSSSTTVTDTPSSSTTDTVTPSSSTTVSSSITSATTELVTQTSTSPIEQCQFPGLRCSSDGTRVELCVNNGDGTFVANTLVTCSGNTPFCSVATHSCSASSNTV